MSRSDKKIPTIKGVLDKVPVPTDVVAQFKNIEKRILKSISDHDSKIRKLFRSAEKQKTKEAALEEQISKDLFILITLTSYYNNNLKISEKLNKAITNYHWLGCLHSHVKKIDYNKMTSEQRVEYINGIIGNSNPVFPDFSTDKIFLDDKIFTYKAQIETFLQPKILKFSEYYETLNSTKKKLRIKNDDVTIDNELLPKSRKLKKSLLEILPTINKFIATYPKYTAKLNDQLKKANIDTWTTTLDRLIRDYYQKTYEIKYGKGEGKNNNSKKLLTANTNLDFLQKLILDFITVITGSNTLSTINASYTDFNKNFTEEIETIQASIDKLKDLKKVTIKNDPVESTTTIGELNEDMTKHLDAIGTDFGKIQTTLENLQQSDKVTTKALKVISVVSSLSMFLLNISNSLKAIEAIIRST